MAKKERIPSVLIPLAQGCEELEAVTIIDLLRRAEVEVVTASLDGTYTQPITVNFGFSGGAVSRCGQGGFAW